MKEKLKTALGGIVGLGLAYLAGWALNESAFVHQLIALGLVFWLSISFVGFTLAAVGWIAWLFFRHE